MRKLALSGLLSLLLTSPALAQGSIQQSGAFTTGHVPVIVSNGLLGDAGTATAGKLNALGITATGTPFCINDALTTSSSGYHQLCLGANSQGGGLLSYNAFGGASAQPFYIYINGALTPIGTGTVNSGTAGQLTWYGSTGTTLSGNANVTAALGALTLGQAGSVGGSLVLSGSSSGTVTLGTGAAAGGYSFTLPSTAGTSGQVLTSGGGSQLTWSNSSGSVVAGSAGQFAYYPSSTNSVSGSSVLSVSGTALSTSGTLTTGAGLTVSTGGAAITGNTSVATGTFTASGGADTLSPASANVVISPTGTGVVTIAPGTLGTMDNMTIGGTTKAAGSFTTLNANTTIAAGIAASQSGTFNLSGGTSGTISIKPQAAAGTYNFNLPITVGSSGQPLLSAAGGSSPMTWGSLSGNTSTFATTTGALTSGHLATFDASGNIQDGGAVPTGSINSGTANQLTYYAGSGTTVSGNANLTVSSGALTVGVAGAAAGSVLLTGSSTGTVTIKGSGTTIGTYNFNLPTTAGSANQPLLSGGGGASANVWGTVTGTTTLFPTFTGSTTNGNCVAMNAAGNLLDNGSPCGSGGSGTVTSSTANQIAYYASSTNAVAGNSALTISGGTLTTGVTSTTTGKHILAGGTSGAVTIAPQAAAGTYEFDLPTTAGSAGQVLTSQGGAGVAMTWGTPSSWPPAPTAASNGATSAAANTLYCVDTTSGTATLTLPGSPSNGDKVGYMDCKGTFATNNLTVARNGNKIMNQSADMTVTLNNQGGTLIYYTANTSWNFVQ